MSIIYLLSGTFDYRKLVSGDAGPDIARDYGWATATLDTPRDAWLPDASAIVLDNRIAEAEIPALRSLIGAATCPVFVRIVDPYWPINRDHYWYRFARSVIDAPRVHFVTAYEAAEITSLFRSLARRSRFITAPYVYDEARELPIDHAGRQQRVAFSGATDRLLYPVRHRMSVAAQIFPPIRLKVTRLPHPGYRDIGQPSRHGIVGDRYLEWLSGFTLAFACSSRSRLELLKYREIAYAGCVPIGDLPATLLDAPDDAWMPYRRNWAALARQLWTEHDLQEAALRWRSFIKGRRDKRIIAPWVTGQLLQLG